MTDDDQRATIAFLRGELAGSDPGAEVTTVETHISVVLIGATRVWKVKKAVRLPYLDFGTAARRLAFCERELELNRRTAPELYLAVRRVTQGAGGLAIDGTGETVDAVVEMARFDEAGLLDRLADRGRLDAPLATALAGTIATFHREAEPARGLDASGSARLGEVLSINEQGLDAGKALLDPGAIDRVVHGQRALWREHAALLDGRQEEGRVRLCHGDLHLRNIVAIDGRPVLFDGIEFDDGLATIDVLYDLAFLLMDLWHRDLRDTANRVLNRYLDQADETDGLALLPLFLAMRATVRAHVAAARHADARPDERAAVADEARRYLDLAASFLEDRPPRLVAIGGRSGTGKSTVAAAVAAGIGRAPGARVLSSDRIRKALFGVAPETRLPPEAYSAEVSERVYGRLFDEAARVLATGHGVIADAVFDREPDRARLERIAAQAGVAFAGVWLDAPERVLLERVAARTGDPSDATSEVVRAQVARDPGPIGWRRVDASGGDPRHRLAERLGLART
ncbi:AAA family ATPase [Marinivivus vitaminiproducens]|uniref:bifunctional aminoglycoside phosphotransferase/ATP-binding protein n=1 Tax=Marinivivus vitaminiproducens TaxID=3035935 RepID=UPI00279E11C2|nr:AAA family ATPase [Geminicoccaceae bacterium SCSIO 64248]